MTLDKNPCVYGVERSKVTWRVTDGEAVVIYLRTGRYFCMNPSATWIWALLAERPRTEAEIIHLFATSHSRPQSDASFEVTEFLAGLLDADLLDMAEEDLMTSSPTSFVAPFPAFSSHYEPPQLTCFDEGEAGVVGGE